jgi:hypothetical protein
MAIVQLASPDFRMVGATTKLPELAPQPVLLFQIDERAAGLHRLECNRRYLNSGADLVDRITALGQRSFSAPDESGVSHDVSSSEEGRDLD